MIEGNLEDNDSPRFIEIPPYGRPANAVEESHQIYEKMKLRRTVRQFSTEPVDRNIVINAIRVACTAPNGANCQPWFFALIESQALKDQIREEAEKVERRFYSGGATEQWLEALAPLGTNSNKEYLSVAPALIAVFTRHQYSSDCPKGKSYYPVESTGIAVGMLLTALHCVGLATLTHTPRPMNFLSGLLGLDRTFRPFMVVVVGYPQVPIFVPNIHRKPLTETFRAY